MNLHYSLGLGAEVTNDCCIIMRISRETFSVKNLDMRVNLCRYVIILVVYTFSEGLALKLVIQSTGVTTAHHWK